MTNDKYSLRLTLWDGRSYPVTTGMGDCTDEEAIGCLVFQYKENNWSCDCNRELGFVRAFPDLDPRAIYGIPNLDEGCCLGGPKIRIKRFEVLREDVVIYKEEPFEAEILND